MASRKSRRSLGYKNNEQSALARLINERLDQLNMTQRDLAEAANMPEARLSRIMRGRREKGNSVAVTEQDLAQIALGLKIGKAGWDKLRYAAWPELTYIDEAFRLGENVIDLNGRLIDNGLPPLGIPPVD